MRNVAILLAVAAAAVALPRAALAADPPASGPAGGDLVPGPVTPDDETDLGDPGYVLERVEVRGNDKTTTSLIIALAALRVGGPWNERQARLARLRLLTTGYFMKVELSLARGSRPGFVVLLVDVIERNTLLLRDLFVGSSAQVPIVFGLELAETNLFGTGMYLSGAFVAGFEQAALSLRWADPALGESRIGVGISLVYANAFDHFGTRCRTFVGRPGAPDERCEGVEGSLPDAVEYARLHYRRAGGTSGLSLAVSSFTSLYFDLRLESLKAEFPDGASAVPPREDLADPIDFSIVEGASLLVSGIVTFEVDSRDHPYLPRSGTLFTATAELSHRYIGSSYQFVKLAAHFQHVWRLRRNDALKVDVVAGAIFGDAPFFNRFYVGDVTELVPYRNLEVAMSARPAPTILPSSVDRMRYEDYVARVSVEYAIPVREKIGKFVYNIDLFFRPGVWALASAEDLRALGDRRPPIDLTFDLGFRADTFIGDFSLSFGNLIGVVPF